MSTPDLRTPSEHDCDRILYSDAFRRLGGVTQVVAVGEMPLFHTRLTHTLKVQQLARRIAEHLDRNPHNTDIVAAIGGIDASAAEAAGLAHDLGHPPFGHIGETVLNEMCQKHGLDGFEGNAQTLRVVGKLSRRDASTDFGLDLSPVTLRGVLKYPWLRTGDHRDATKWNAYPTERALFELARAGFAHEAQSIEAAVMDWADDITYAVHDLEDFVRAGRVPIESLATRPGEFDAFIERAGDRVAGKYPDVQIGAVVESFRAVVTTAFAQFRLHKGASEQLALLRGASSFLIGNYVGAATLRAGETPLEVPDQIRAEVELFKQLTWHYVINDPRLATMQEGQMRLVAELFTRLATWLEEAERDNQMFRLPTRLVDLYEITLREPGSEAYPNQDARYARAVSDYIASLTESQAIDLFGRLTHPGTHSVLDPWLAY